MALTLTHDKSGRQVTVPEDAAGVYLDNGWSVSGVPAKAAPKKAAAPRKRAATKKAAPAKAETEVTDAGAGSGEGAAVPSAADGGAEDEG